MVRMKVSFHATVRDAAGTQEVEADASSVRELLEVLHRRFGTKFHSMLVKDGALREDVVILVNGQNISHTGGMDAKLEPGDDVAIFPPVSGG
jgi:molybdopterin synthase sulfur carrier subunit